MSALLVNHLCMHSTNSLFFFSLASFSILSIQLLASSLILPDLKMPKLVTGLPLSSFLLERF